MGSGSRVRQYERRFFEGELTRGGEREEGHSILVKAFREYEIRKTGDGYELLKGGEVVGVFPKAEIEKDRVVFKLNKGMNLEVSERGVREIFSPEKAKLCGLIAADGYIGKRGKGIYEVSLTTVDEEMVEIFKRLSKEVYGIIPHKYLKHHKIKGEIRENYDVPIFSKRVFYDLQDFGIKGPEHYEFHPPLKYLDKEGRRAYLRGFFSGDGTVGMSKSRYTIRIDSTCKKGLEELREILISVGFHPHEIHEQEPGEPRRTRYSFRIPEEEYLKFIEEIGSEKREHKYKFELIRRIYEEKKRRKERAK